jgi:MFS family permease
MRMSAANIYIAFSGLIGLVYNITGAYFIIMLYEFGITLEKIGIILSVYTLTVLLIDYPTGVVADIIGRKTTYCLGLALEGSSLVIFSLNLGYHVMILASVISGFGVAMMSGSFSAWVVEEIKKEREDWKEVISRVFSLSSGIGTAAGLASGFLASLIAIFGTRYPILVSGALLVIISLFLLIIGGDNRGRLEKKPLRILVEGLKHLRRREFLLCVISSSMMSGAFWAFAITWQPLFHDVHGLGKEGYGVLFSIMLLGMSLGNFSVPVLSKLFSRWKILISALLMRIPLFIALGLTRELYSAVFIVALIEFTLGVVGPLMATVFNLLIPSELRASLLSLSSSADSLTNTLVGPIAGLIVSILGYSALYNLAALMWLASALLLLPVLTVVSRTRTE